MFKSTCAIAAVILLLVGTGCRTPDPTVDLLESELRWLEDNLYQLDHQLDLCHSQLESARRNNTLLRRELAAAGRRRQSTDATRANENDTGYDLESEEDLYKFEAPIVELGDPDDGARRREDRLEGAGEQSIPNLELQIPQTDKDPVNREEGSARTGSDPKRVAKILLNRRLTGGYDFDGRPGHEGIMVVIEPQNTAGQYVAVPGELSIEVTDPSGQGSAAAVEKWRFDAVEAAAFFKESLLGRGAHLTLPWPGEPPNHDRLRLTVFYDTTDGRRLRAEKMIKVNTDAHALASRAGIAAHAAAWTSEPLGDSDHVKVVDRPEWRPTRPQ